MAHVRKGNKGATDTHLSRSALVQGVVYPLLLSRRLVPPNIWAMVVGRLLVKSSFTSQSFGRSAMCGFYSCRRMESQRGNRERTISRIAKIFTTASEHTAFLPPAGGCHFIAQTNLRYRPTKPKLIRVRRIVLTVFALLLAFVVCVGVGVG